MTENLHALTEPFDSGYLETEDGHKIYYERVGNPEGSPVVFLHGGPGGGISPKQRQFFDPKKYHVIMFDQRGAGKSEPYASLENNTTWDLVDDIERLRKKFDIANWIVFGGSWGSTLALTYAISFPEKVKALVLRGIFLCTSDEINWFYQKGASQIFPEAWQEYIKPIPANSRSSMIHAYHKILTSDNEEEKIKAARAWAVWEGTTSRLLPDSDAIASLDDPKQAIPFARIECHYFVNQGFFPMDNWIMRNIDMIQDIPGYIVQGRYDVICPPVSAFNLHQAWSNSQLIMIPDEGHSAFEPKISAVLTKIMNELN